MPMDDPLDNVTTRRLLARAAAAQHGGRLPSLTVAVSDDRHLLWSAGRGRVHGDRPTTDVQYRIGSITKTFTAVLVLQLRDDGLLRLSDPIDRWLPRSRALAGRNIADLLCHAGGIRAETSPPWWERTPGRTWEQLTADLDDDGARDSTRGRFHYSNMGYAALGHLVSRLRGGAWHDVLAERVLAPLGLRRTTVAPQQPAAEGWAVHPWSDTLIAEPVHHTGAMAPAGQLWSTAEDLTAWGRFLLGDSGDVLTASTLEEMRQPRLATGRASDGTYGLGLEVTAEDRRTIIGHGGSMPGFLAQLRVDCDERLAAVALANATAGLDPALPDDLIDTVRRRRPRIVDEWEPRGTGERDLTELVGVWYWGPRPYTVATTQERDVLTLDAIGQPGRHTRLDLRGEQLIGRGGYFDGEPLTVRRRDDGTVSHLELASFVFSRQPYEPVDIVPGGSATHGDTSR